MNFRVKEKKEKQLPIIYIWSTHICFTLYFLKIKIELKDFKFYGSLQGKLIQIAFLIMHVFCWSLRLHLSEKLAVFTIYWQFSLKGNDQTDHMLALPFNFLLISFKYLTYRFMLILMDLRRFSILPREKTKSASINYFRWSTKDINLGIDGKVLSGPYATSNLEPTCSVSVKGLGLFLDPEIPEAF